MTRRAQSRKAEDSAATLVRLLQPGSWIPASHAIWRPVVESLLTSFLRRFDPKALSRLVEDQMALSDSASPAERAAVAATGMTAVHKICQILARSSHLSEDARAALAPLERLPASAISDESLAAAVALAATERPDLIPGPGDPRVARGSVADVFQFQTTERDVGKRFAMKTARPDAIDRVRREADILLQMAGDAAATALVLGPDFSRVLVGVLCDANRALLREIDFEGEAANLRAASDFYKNDDRVLVPKICGKPNDRGIFMDYIDGSPLLETPLDDFERREAARMVFRSVLLDPLFSGLEETIFHADPHAGNILAQTRNGEVGIALVDWSQAGRLRASQRHAIIELSLYCLARTEPSRKLLAQLFESNELPDRVSIPDGTGNPLRAAFEIVQQLAFAGFPVPENLLLLRKSFFTVEGICLHLDACFDSWRETRTYALGVLASEAAIRAWSIPFAWLDQPGFYRSGLTTRTIAANLAGGLRSFVQTQNNC